VRGAILGAFFVLALPLGVLALAKPDAAARVLPIYWVTLGLTHFLATGLLYFDAANLRHFARTRSTRALYFAVPAALLLGTGLLSASAWGAGEGGSFLFVVVMAANFAHVSRQSFGVLQFFKRQSGAIYGEGLRSLESLFFWALVVLQLGTLSTDGRFDASAPTAQLSVATAAALAIVIAGLHTRAILRLAPGDRSGAATALAYLALQALSGCLAIYSTHLYTIALAMHYVESHVLMAPRILRTRVDPMRRIDRLRGVLQATPALLYLGLLTVAWALWFAVRGELEVSPATAALPAQALDHALDGLFMSHFFLETLVWRLRERHHRSVLEPLYFGDQR
jgi:hypothetical protein